MPTPFIDISFMELTGGNADAAKDVVPATVAFVFVNMMAFEQGRAIIAALDAQVVARPVMSGTARLPLVRARRTRIVASRAASP